MKLTVICLTAPLHGEAGDLLVIQGGEVAIATRQPAPAQTALALPQPAPKPAPAPVKRGIGRYDRRLDILELFATGERLHILEVAKKATINPSTACNYCTSMVREGLLARVARGVYVDPTAANGAAH